MLSANYRNMIIDALENYDTENISIAISIYYPEIKPRIEAISKRILHTEIKKDCHPAIIIIDTTSTEQMHCVSELTIRLF